MARAFPQRLKGRVLGCRVYKKVDQLVPSPNATSAAMPVSETNMKEKKRRREREREWVGPKLTVRVAPSLGGGVGPSVLAILREAWAPSNQGSVICK